MTFTLTTEEAKKIYVQLQIIIEKSTTEIESLQKELKEEPIFIDVIKVGNDEIPSIFIRIGKMDYRFTLTNVCEIKQRR